MKRAVVASIAGLAVTAVTILALNEIGEDHDLAAALGQIGPYRLALIWYMLLGVGLGLVTLAARYHWLVSAIPAVLLFLVHLPVFLGRFPTFPTWYPSWLHRALAFGRPIAFVIVGLLTAVSIWQLVPVLRRTDSASPAGSA